MYPDVSKALPQVMTTVGLVSERQVWSAWSPWSDCSATCVSPDGTVSRGRVRACTLPTDPNAHGIYCPGAGMEVQKCTAVTNPCPGLCYKTCSKAHVSD